MTFFHCVESCLRNEPPISLQTDCKTFFFTFNSRKFVDIRIYGGEIPFAVVTCLMTQHYFPKEEEEEKKRLMTKLQRQTKWGQ